jgi:hypothetical protein
MCEEQSEKEQKYDNVPTRNRTHSRRNETHSTSGLSQRNPGDAPNTVNLSPKGGKKGQESSKSGIMSERKKKELSDVPITANGWR